MHTNDGIYCISDAHLGLRLSGAADREELLIRFFRQRVSRGTHLFIVGDLFDFWIEYTHAIRPDYVPVVCELKRLCEQGVEVHYLCGNHDFAIGPFLRDTIGVHIHTAPFQITLQGKRLYFFHGDGLLKKDVGYRVLRRILRNPVNQRLFKLLHPNLGIPVAQLVSGSSRHLLSFRMSSSHLYEYRQAAYARLQQDNDIVVFGHTHVPELSIWDDRVYCNTGTWLKKRTFAHLYEGSMALYEYTPDDKTVAVAPSYAPPVK